MNIDVLVRFRSAYWRALHAADTIRLRQWEESHLTLPQIRVLHEVRRTPGITTGELGRLLGVTMSTASGLVIKLVDRGLLQRTVAPEDRRQAPLRLTPEGEALVGELADEGRAFLNQVATRLGPDLDSVVDALEHLSRAAASLPPEEPAPESARVLR